MKWVEIAQLPSRERYSLLSRFMKDHGIENEVSIEETEPDAFKDRFSESLKNSKMIFIGTPYGEAVVGLMGEVPAHILYLKACDTLVRESTYWRMESALLKGFERILGEVGPKMDLNLSVLIVGAGATARVVIYAFIKLGVKKFNITNKFDDQAYALLKDLKAHYFDVEFEFVPKERLVTLPGNNSVLVNTTPLIPSNDVLQELYYFNFLRSTGLVIDLTVFPITTPLVKEAESIGIKAVRGYEIASYMDLERLKFIGGAEFDRSQYAGLLKQELEKQTFDLTPFEVPS